VITQLQLINIIIIIIITYQGNTTTTTRKATTTTTITTTPQNVRIMRWKICIRFSRRLYV
jgi:hypothetical protein